MSHFLLMALLLFFSSLIIDLHAQEALVSNSWPSQNNWEVDIGFRKDRLKWSIGGVLPTIDGFQRVNVLSELQWKDLRIAQIGASLNYASKRNYAIRVAADYGHIYHGRNIDADYAGNDRTELFSLSNNNAGKGYVYDVSGGVGYRITSDAARCTITPLIGYSVHEQSLHSFQGNQLFCFDVNEQRFCETGSFQGLNSTYKAEWYGPWAGADFSVRVEKCAYIFGGFEWHLASYRGVGKWNLRNDLGPFHHKAHGTGYLAMLGGNWEIWRNISIGLISHFRNFQTRAGKERNNIKTDFGSITLIQPFNHAKWRSYDISLLIGWRF